MGFLSRLRQLLSTETRSKPPVKTPGEINVKRERNAIIQKEWLTLNTPYFFGKMHISPDKRWIVGCCDSDGNGAGGFRERVMAEFCSWITRTIMSFLNWQTLHAL